MFNKSNSRFVVLKNKIPGTFRLIHELQYDSDKQTLEKKIENFDRKVLSASNLVKKPILMQKSQKIVINKF